jgi:hypothetical protein
VSAKPIASKAKEAMPIPFSARSRPSHFLASRNQAASQTTIANVVTPESGPAGS